MKRIIILLAFALFGCAAVAAGNSWTLTSNAVMTENAASGTPWILAVEIKNSTEIWIKKVNQVGDSTALDFSGAIEGADGKYLHSIDGFSGKTTLVSVKLPDCLKRLEADAFGKCSAMTTVTPLLPASLEFLGYRAFSRCSSLEGDVVFPATLSSTEAGWTGDPTGNGCFYGTRITSCDMSQSTIAIPGRCFGDCKQLKWVKLPQGVKEIPEFSFAGAVSLTDVTPFLPATVNKIGQRAFQKCASLALDLKLATSEEIYFPGDNNGSYAFEYSAIRSVEMTTPQTYLGSEWPGNRDNGFLFANMTNCWQIILPKEVDRVMEKTFNECKALTNIVFQGGFPVLHEEAFLSMRSNVTRIFIPRFDETWNAFFEDSRYTPIERWSSSVTNAYLSNYPNEMAMPLGSLEVGGRRYWVSDIYPWQQDKVVHVCGFPCSADSQEAAVAPSYGSHEGFENGETMVFTAPESATFEGGRYRCVGHVLRHEMTPGKRDYSAPVTNSSTTCSITQTDGRVWHLVWLWEPASYGVNVAKVNGHAGDVSISPASDVGYDPGAVITLTASGVGGGQFVRWVGDVPAGCEKNPVISVTVDSSKNIQAIFSSPWTYDTSAQTITDGNWVLEVKSASFAENALTVQKVRSVENEIFLDLGRSASDSDSIGYSIVEIAQDVFKNRGIRFLVLGDNVAKLQDRAFLNCAQLETVEPLLPSSLVKLGQGVFANAKNLVGDVVFPANEIEVPTSWVDYGWFSKTKISSCDMSKATVTRVIRNSFDSCENLVSVKLPKNLSVIGEGAFGKCTALTTIEPFLPDTVVYVDIAAFYNCTALSSDLVMDGDNLISFLRDPNNPWRGAFTGCKSIKNAKVLRPIEGTTKAYPNTGANEGLFPKSLFYECTLLENVEIGKSVTNMDVTVFSKCVGLKDIVYYGKAPTFANTTFENVTDKKIRFHVSKAEQTWNDFRAERVTPMDENLIAQWESVYPGEALPKGQFTLSGKKMWLYQDFGLSGMYMIFR